MRVLLIEDDETVAGDLRVLLPPDIELTWASGRSQAEEILRWRPPLDAILLDLCLDDRGEGAGLELLSELRTTLAPDVPVLVLTSARSERAEADCFRRGARAFLSKPCVIGELIRQLVDASKPAP